MARYKCPGCGARLESPSSMAGQDDKCPICGHVCTVPRGLRNMPLIAGACALLVLGIVAACVYWAGGNRTTRTPPVSSGNISSGQSTTKALNQPLTVEYLEESTDTMIVGGYGAHILIEPMTKTQLEALGHRLIAKMHRLNATHLLARIYYNRADHAIDQWALTMHASGPDYKLRLLGPIPEATTPQGLLEAYVSSQSMLGSSPEKEGGWCEYNPRTATLVYHDRWIGAFRERLHMPAIIVGMTSMHLLPWTRNTCWASLPGLKRVVVHFYEKNATEPVATISFGRSAFVRSLQPRKTIYKKESEVEEMQYHAMKRLRAKVMSYEEYRVITDNAARQIYTLYEDLWVEVSGDVDIQLHRTLPKAPPEFYRQYFFE